MKRVRSVYITHQHAVVGSGKDVQQLRTKINLGTTCDIITIIHNTQYKLPIKILYRHHCPLYYYVNFNCYFYSENVSRYIPTIVAILHLLRRQGPGTRSRSAIFQYIICDQIFYP